MKNLRREKCGTKSAGFSQTGALLVSSFFILHSSLSFAQPSSPHLAYVYPAGGEQGATFQITVGGQYLRLVSSASVTGAGIHAKVIEYDRPMNQKEFKDLRDQLKKLQDKWRRSRRVSSGTNVWTATDQTQFAEIRSKILKNPPNRQANPAMAETVLVRITIATNAAPGQHEIRLRAPNGLSNPLNFFVGQLPEYSKPPAKSVDPALQRLLDRLGDFEFQFGRNGGPAMRRRLPAHRFAGIHRGPAAGPESVGRIRLPATVNGQILPGGVDGWRFSARKGRELVIRVRARALIPYLADAVPGWFEATATVYDAKGHELAYDDRFHFRPDPVIHFTVPHDGDYVVEIHDSIYRGREDFVYRMTIGELPFITDIFPPGGQAGTNTTVQLNGWNLPTHLLTLNNTGKEPGIDSISVSEHGKLSNRVPFAVGLLRERLERESNNSFKTAQVVELPIIINGRIDSPGDDDVFRFEGRAGEPIVAEVLAHRLGSPLDSTLELTGAAGKRLAFNDDYDDEGAGLETDHADSCLTATLPADGTYFIRLRDAQHHGGPAYAYRLRLSEPRPDFALRVVPSSLNVRAGMSVPVTVHVLRKDGFTNAIELRLKDAPSGFSLGGGRIPENQDKMQFTLEAPRRAGRAMTDLSLEGIAVVAGHAILHPAVPADDRMQAFAYWHLVPAQALEVAVGGGGRPFAAKAIRILSATPVKIPAGGTAHVRIAVPTRAFATRFEFELNGAPDGVLLRDVQPAPKGIEMDLHCDAAKTKPGLAGNLIVNVLLKRRAPATKAKRPQNLRAFLVGTLPAIPFEVVAD